METLIEYLKIIIKYRKVFYRVTAGFIAFSIILSLIVPNKYRATAQLLPPVEETDLLGLSSVLQSLGGATQMRSLARMAGMAGIAPTTLETMRAILLSRTITERVVEKCDLMRIFKTKYMEDAIKRLNNITTITILTEGVIQIKVEGKSPYLIAKIANTYINELDNFMRISNMTKGKNTRIFIEGRLADVERNLRAAEESLKTFQKRYKVIALDNETKAAIENYVKLKTELIRKEVEITVSQNYASSDNPYVSGIKNEIDAIKKSLADIESRSQVGNGFGVGFAVSFKNLPEIGTEYVRKYRELKVMESIYGLLMQQYEQAKILEARDTPAITVLDYAVPPKRKIWPKRVLIILLFITVGICVSLTYSIIKESSLKSKKINVVFSALYEMIKILKQDFGKSLKFVSLIKK